MTTDIDIGPPSSEGDLQRFGVTLAHSLGFPPDRAPLWLERVGARNVRIARRGADVAGGVLLVPMGHWVGGRVVPCTGISGVAVAPEHRSRGVGGELMRVAIEEAHRDGVPLSSLYPATFPVYRAAGYEAAGTRIVYRVPLANLGAGDREPEMREVLADERGILRDLYDAQARTVNGAIARTPYFWARIHEPFSADNARAFIVEGDTGPEGYAVLWYRPGGGALAPNELPVRDVVARTPRAARRILRLLADHRSVARTATIAGGPASTLLLHMAEPRIEVSAMEQWMLRIVDVRGALERRGWSPLVRGELHLDVRDALLRENSRRWVLEIANGQAEVREGGSGAVTLDVRGLAALYTGHLSGPDLRVAGLADGADAELAKATALFCGSAPWDSDLF